MKKYLLMLVMGLAVLPMLSFAEVQGDVNPNPISSCVSITHNLAYQSRDISTGGDVSTLQDFLEVQGYLHSDPTGYFGLQTQSAVKAFQLANGILNSGYVGTITRADIHARCTTASTSTTPVISPTTVCPLGAMFNTLTGAPCSSTSITPITPPATSSYNAQSSVTSTTPVTSPNNGSSLPTVTGISPSTASAGSNVTVIGTGFTPTGNTVVFGGPFSSTPPSIAITTHYYGQIGGIPNLNSSDGKTISFTIPVNLQIPESCAAEGQPAQNCSNTTLYLIPSNPNGINVINANGNSATNLLSSNNTRLTISSAVPSQPVTPPTTPAAPIISNVQADKTSYNVGDSYTLTWNFANVPPVSANAHIGIALFNTSGSRVLNIVNTCDYVSPCQNISPQEGNMTFTGTIPASAGTISPSISTGQYKFEVSLISNGSFTTNGLSQQTVSIPFTTVPVSPTLPSQATLIQNLVALITSKQGLKTGSVGYDSDFDLNNDGSIDILDIIQMRNFASQSVSIQTAIYNKMIDAVQSRISTSTGNTNYISQLDIDNNGSINILDVVDIRNILSPTTS